MRYYGLIDAISDYCEKKGHIFIAGGDEYRAFRNILIDNPEYVSNQLIVFAGFETTPKMFNNRAVGVSYSGVLGVGRKSETNEETEEETISNLDETYKQKYDLRLSALATELMTLIFDVCCSNEIECTRVVFGDKINQTDLNADFVEAQITIEQE